MPLYDALLARRSVRRYSKQAVEPEQLDRVREFITRVEPLVPGPEFTCSVRPVTDGDELAAAAGGYGRIVSAPFVLVPALQDGPHVLVDFGFRVEQLVIRLTQLGLGSCWVGALLHEEDAAKRFALPAGRRIAAVIAFGYASTGPGGRLVNAAVRSAVGAARYRPFAEFVSAARYGTPASVTELRVKVLEALRRAPSTGNARPWHVVLVDDLLHLAVRVDAAYYRASGNVGYHLVDAGIGMANLSLALLSVGSAAKWRLSADAAADCDRLGFPANILPVASIPLSA